MSHAWKRTHDAGNPADFSLSGDERRQMIEYFQDVVDGGYADWSVNDQGLTEIHLRSGAVFRMNGAGIFRVK